MDYLSEADTRSKLVDPALYARGWTEDLIRREETARAIEIIEGRPRRQRKGRIDYTLRIRVNPDTQPVAVALIEAKPAHLPPTHGLEQVKLYGACKRLNVPFVFSTNGHLFVEFDRTTQTTSAPRPIAEFPSPADLRTRYEQALGFSLDDEIARPLLMRYPGGEATRRYYQDAAIRAVLEKLARCEKTGEPKRALLPLATGSGKTFIAVNLLKRIADAGQLRRCLFVCDRDELRNQGLGAFQGVFGADAAEVRSGNPQKNARVLIATYQTLNVDTDEADANFLTANYPENYFSHIVIDECHRSAWGKWSQILTRNPHAVQVGLTATPRQLKTTEKTPEAQYDLQVNADNLCYFGEPVYEYDMSQGIEDGYLAACEIIQGDVNIDDTGITIDDVLARNPTNAITGEPVTREELQELYEKTDYEDRIMLPDRVAAMTEDFFEHLLLTGGPCQKAIIFCVRDMHADAIAVAMNNLYARWCQDQGQKPAESYAFKCTAASSGQQYLADLRGATRSHFVATTVELLTTGVDVPCVGNIIFFKYVRSPIAFHQMVGRGTRIHEATAKLMFRVYDYTNATRLFGKGFVTVAPTPRPAGGAAAGGVQGRIVIITRTANKKASNSRKFATQQSLDSYIKGICDIMRRSNCAGALQYVPELTWILFLRILDEHETYETEYAEAVGAEYAPSLSVPYRWQDWAAPGGTKRVELESGTLGAFFAFVDHDLIPHLKGLRDRPNATPRQKVIGEMFSGLERTRIDTERNLLDILDKVHDISASNVDPTHVFTLSQVYEGLLLKMGQKGNDGGQFFTPRQIIKAMVQVIAPRIGETVYDPACGTGGFLAQAYEYMKQQRGDQITAVELETLKRGTFYGREKDNAIYPIALANLVLHDIDEPHIWHGNSLTGMETYGGLFQGAPALYDVILMNPPFGGKEGKDAQTRFAYKTGSTQVLFLQHVIETLKSGGRAGVVVDEGALFRTNETAFVQTKRKLLDDCDLWCIISLPPGTFVSAGAGVKANLLFFTKGSPTERIWYYDLSARKVTKKNPLTLADFEEFFRLLPDRADSERSWTVTREDIEAGGYDLKAVNPNTKTEEDTRTPAELLAEIQTKGREVAEAIEALKTITADKSKVLH